MLYADNEGPDQPVHPRDLIRVSGVRLKNRTQSTHILQLLLGYAKGIFTHAILL